MAPQPLLPDRETLRFDEATGAIVLPGGRLGPETTREAYLASPLASSDRHEPAEGERQVHGLTLAGPEGAEVGLALIFHRSRLVAVGVALPVPGDAATGERWVDEAYARERRRDRLHQTWLREMLGQEPYEYAWGRAAAGIDPHTGDAAVWVVYET